MTSRGMGRPRSASDADVFAAIDDLVNESGPKGVTFARVAAAVGVTASALAQRFGTKHGMLVAYADERSTLVDDVFAEAKRHHDRPIEALPAALAALTASITSQHAMANSIAFLHLDLVDDELRVFAVAQSRLIRRHIARLLRQAIAAGHLDHADPRALARLVYAVYSGAMVTWAMDGTGTLPRWIHQHIEATLAPYRLGRPANV